MANLLSIIKAAEDIKRLYDENPGSHTFNTIIHGPIKVGKTTMLRTCRNPVLVHSFDPGGTEVLEREIREGKIIVDNRFETEDPYNPKAFRLWCDEFNRLVNMGFFDHIGTFAMDSITTWQQIIMYEVIRQAHANFPKKRTIGSQPFEQDWLPQMQYIENYMRKFLSLPCDCVLLGHSEIPTDREGNIVGDLGIMVTGKLKNRLPALFSEIYYLRIKNYQTGERELLTQPTSMGAYNIMAGSRLGKEGKLDRFEKPDFKNILAKVGKPTKDKPLFKDLAKETVS